MASDIACCPGGRLMWDPPDPGEWEFDASHQSSPATATGQAVQIEAVRTRFGRAFARFGLPLSHMAMEFVNDWGYLNAFVHGAPRKGSGKPPPPIVLKLLSRLLPAARRRSSVAGEAIRDQRAMQEVERYHAMRPQWISANPEFEDVDLAGLGDPELADHVHRSSDHLVAGMTMHFDLIGQAAAVGEYLVRTQEWGLEPAMAAKAAFHGAQTSIEAGRRLVEAGTLAQVDDVWTPEPEEIADLLVGRRRLSAEAIAERVERRVVKAAATPPLHLGSHPRRRPISRRSLMERGHRRPGRRHRDRGELSGYGFPMQRNRLVQFGIFILVLVLINVVLAIFGSGLRISIIGSIVLTVVVGGAMSLTNR